MPPLIPGGKASFAIIGTRWYDPFWCLYCNAWGQPPKSESRTSHNYKIHERLLRTLIREGIPANTWYNHDKIAPGILTNITAVQ